VIFLDTNVISETLKRTPDPGVTAWLGRFDVELALSTVAIAEVAYGIEKIRPDQRAQRLERGLAEIRRHFADRIYPFTEQAALLYGVLMGERTRSGRPMSVPDAMIAAIARTHGAGLATRNLADFQGSGLELISPWTA
jgi:predicted nucleic acid-binding protein